MLLVLDASAIINEPNFSFEPQNSYITTQAVANEFKSLETRHLIENALHHGFLSVKNPSTGTIQNVLHLIAEKGFRPLSKADVSVIALAIELKGEKKEFTVLTDDFSIQNFLKLLKIPFSSILQGEIKGSIEFSKKCTGCAKEYSPDFTQKKCPHCGLPLKSKMEKTQ